MPVMPAPHPFFVATARNLKNPNQNYAWIAYCSMSRLTNMAEYSDAGDSTEAGTLSFFSALHLKRGVDYASRFRVEEARMAIEPSYICYLALTRLNKGLVEAHHRSLEGKVSSQGRAANSRYNTRLQTWRTCIYFGRTNVYILHFVHTTFTVVYTCDHSSRECWLKPIGRVCWRQTESLHVSQCVS